MEIPFVATVDDVTPAVLEHGVYILGLEEYRYDQAMRLIDFTRENITLIQEHLRPPSFNSSGETSVYDLLGVDIPGYDGDRYYGISRATGLGRLMMRNNSGIKNIKDLRVAEYLRNFVDLDQFMLSRRRAIDEKLGLARLRWPFEMTYSRIMSYPGLNHENGLSSDSDEDGQPSFGIGPHLDTNRQTSTVRPLNDNGHLVKSSKTGEIMEVRLIRPSTVETTGTQTEAEVEGVNAALHKAGVGPGGSISFFHGSALRLWGSTKVGAERLKALHQEGKLYF